MQTVFLVVALTAPVFKSPLGFEFTPPPGFETMGDLPPSDTRAVAPAPPGAHQQLVAAFAEQNDDPASLAVALVDAPLALDRGSPERLASLAIDHLHELFNVDLHIEWIEKLPDPSVNGAPGFEAIELAGKVSFIDADSDAPTVERVAQFAFIPFGKRQLVFTASVPAARFQSLGPEIEAAILTLKLNAGAQPDSNHATEIGAAVGGVLGLVVALTRLLWFRRRAILTAPKQDR